MKKHWFELSILALIAVFIVIVVWRGNQGVYVGKDFHVADSIKIEPNDWQPYKAIEPGDSTHVYKVTWSQKYGENQTAYCKVVFRNDKEKQYKLVAPWLNGLEIERANMDDINFNKIPIDSVPAGVLNKK